VAVNLIPTGDSVFDLNPWVNLDEVMSAHLINQELGSARIPVANALGKLDGIIQNSLSNVFGEMGGRSNLDDLLMAPLDGTITLKHVNCVSGGIGKDLDFNMPWPFQETFDEDGAIAERGLGFGHGALERVFEVGLFADDTHTTTASTHGSFDDDYRTR